MRSAVHLSRLGEPGADLVLERVDRGLSTAMIAISP
jgi:hypothetical protein